MAGEDRREQLYDHVLSAGHPDLLYCMVRGWNWSNGTWLLRWIADQPSCTRSTAQLIFWNGEPEHFLLDGGPEDEEHRLATQVLARWTAGRYAEDRLGRADRLRLARARSSRRFRDESGTSYRPGQLGYAHPANPMSWMGSYRRAEAQRDPAELRFTVPDDLGELQRLRLPGYATYDLVEGVPEEFLDVVQDDDVA